MNAMNRLGCVLACAVATAITPAAFAVVVDDFETYATGDVDVVATPPWTTEYAGDAQVLADAGNQYLVNQGDGDWAHTYRASGVAIDSAGTFSFRVYAEDDAQTDHAFGLTDSSEAIDWYGDYGPYVRVTDDTAGASGVLSLDVRDGGGFVDDIATLNAQQWYDVSLDIDTAGGGTFDVYVDGSLVYSDAGFRRAYGAPLENVLLMAGNGALPIVRVDDISVDAIPEPTSLLMATVLACCSASRRR